MAGVAASTLDDARRYTRLDPGGVRDLIAALPEQARTAWAAGQEWEIPASFHTPRKVVVLGVGGSAIGAEAVAALGARTSAVPVQVQRGYDPPVTDEDTLAVACSFSGETEETLAAFHSEGAGMRLAIGTGGALAEQAGELGYALFRYGWDGPPRTAFAYGLFPLLAILRRLGVIALPEAEVDAALDGLAASVREWAPAVPEERNLAKRIARRVAGRVPVVVGPDFLAVAATRWATQVNENAGQWAFAVALPEVDHNLVVGFGAPAAARDQLHALLLDAAPVHERNRLRVRLTAQQLEGAGVAYDVVLVEGESMLDSLLRACHLGDWVSLYLAMLNEVNPLTTRPIDEVKAALSRAD